MNRLITSPSAIASAKADHLSLLTSRLLPPMLTRLDSLFVLFALGCFALCPCVQAVVPPPDGGYPGGNTAEGQNALY